MQRTTTSAQASLLADAEVDLLNAILSITAAITSLGDDHCLSNKARECCERVNSAFPSLYLLARDAERLLAPPERASRG